MPSEAATCWLVSPWAHESTMRQRWASAWALVGLLAQRFSVSRSSLAQHEKSLGRPLPAMSPPIIADTDDESTGSATIQA